MWHRPMSMSVAGEGVVYGYQMDKTAQISVSMLLPVLSSYGEGRSSREWSHRLRRLGGVVEGRMTCWLRARSPVAGCLRIGKDEGVMVK